MTSRTRWPTSGMWEVTSSLTVTWIFGGSSVDVTWVTGPTGAGKGRVWLPSTGLIVEVLWIFCCQIRRSRTRESGIEDRGPGAHGPNGPCIPGPHRPTGMARPGNRVSAAPDANSSGGPVTGRWRCREHHRQPVRGRGEALPRPLARARAPRGAALPPRGRAAGPGERTQSLARPRDPRHRCPAVDDPRDRGAALRDRGRRSRRLRDGREPQPRRPRRGGRRPVAHDPHRAPRRLRPAHPRDHPPRRLQQAPDLRRLPVRPRDAALARRIGRRLRRRRLSDRRTAPQPPRGPEPVTWLAPSGR